MKRLKKFAAFALSGAMCLGLAFGAACSDSQGEVDNDGEKGTTSAVKADYFQAIQDTYDDFRTSTTGYEITTNGSAAISYTDEYGVLTDMSYTAKSVVKYKYADGSLGEDQDIYVSGETKYTYDGEQSSETLGALVSARARGNMMYGGYAYGTEAYTSIPDDMLYYQINVDEAMESLAYGDMDYSSILGSLYGYESGELDEQTQSYADMILEIIESPVCAVYGTVETTSSGTTLTFDVLKEAQYLLSTATAIVALIGENTTPEELAENIAVRNLIEMYLGDLTGSDIQSMIEAIIQYAGVETVEIPAATDGQKAYDYILALYKWAVEEEYFTSPDLSEYKEQAEEIIAQCQSAVATCKEFTLDLYFDGDNNYTGYNLSVDIDGSEAYGFTAVVQCGMEIVEKNVTLAAIDESMVYVYSDYVSYGSILSNDYADIYFMADGTIVLGVYDEDENVTYVHTGMEYSYDENGYLASIGGNEVELSYGGYFVNEYVVTFTYNDVEYSYYYYVDIL